MAFNPSLRTLTTLVLSALCSGASASAADRPQAPAASTDAIRKMTVMVPMRDGVRLATDIYQPEPANGPLPVIFTRGPYGKLGAEPLSKVACPKGYIFVSQDMRGRHDSEGDDSVAFHNDGWGKRRDGQDSLDWIAKQPWCNGKIGTHGGSALGITQTMMAPGAPDSLKAQWVFSAFSDMYSQCAYQGGAWRKSLVEYWLDANGFDRKSRDTFLQHPRYDEFWAETNAEAQAASVNAPAVFLGGWYDIFLQGTINSFVTIQDHGGPGARGRCRLFVGPIGHGVFTTLKYPANSRLPDAADAFRFFDRHLNGKTNGVEADKPVHYYVMGDPTDPKAPGNVWRAADRWPPPSQPTPFYLHAGNRLSTERPTGGDARRSFRYNPADPVPTLGGDNLVKLVGPADMRPIESRQDVLVFSTEPLEEPIEVTGRMLAKLFVCSDRPDTDFTAMLTDVYPDGRSMLVADGLLRARYRESFDHEALLETSKTYELTVDLWSTSLVFNKGHRIRVLVSSSNAPRFEPNPNTGRLPRADKEERVATNTVRLSAEAPSHVLLPVYRGPGVQSTPQ